MEYDFTDITWNQFLQLNKSIILDRIRNTLYLQLHNQQFNKQNHQLLELEVKVNTLDQKLSNLR